MSLPRKSNLMLNDPLAVKKVLAAASELISKREAAGTGVAGPPAIPVPETGALTAVILYMSPADARTLQADVDAHPGQPLLTPVQEHEVHVHHLALSEHTHERKDR